MSKEPDKVKWRGIRLAEGEESLPVEMIVTTYEISDVLTAAENIAKGAAVYISSAETVSLANASDTSKSLVIGVSKNAILSGAGGDIILFGPLVVSTFSFTPGKPLWLDITNGGITETPPTGSGQAVIRIGKAISATKILVNPENFYRTL